MFLIAWWRGDNGSKPVFLQQLSEAALIYAAEITANDEVY